MGRPRRFGEAVVADVSRRQAAALLPPQLRDDDPVAGVAARPVAECRHLARDGVIARIDSVPFWLLVT
jgi:hypothetical protein